MIETTCFTWIAVCCVGLQILAGISGVAAQSPINPHILEHPQDQFVARDQPATLNCKAESVPEAQITWYKNGVPVRTATDKANSHRILLPSGQLFFLEIVYNNRESDIGVYYCNATNPITNVSAVSRNATLQLASIRDGFAEHPDNTNVALGDTAILDCRGPRGEPEPHLTWRKDGEQVQESARIVKQASGSLMLQRVEKSDSGIYVCIASNVAGERESNPARLQVLEKPEFDVVPIPITAKEGDTVEFQCQARGDPSPSILWRRDNGEMPEKRTHILPDRSIQVTNVQASDQGSYICRAVNPIGHVETSVMLTVHSEPSFLVTPRDKMVGLGRRVTFRCEVTGSPMPTIFWSKENTQMLIFPRQDQGRLSVQPDGTLVIDPVKREDEGNYLCQAMSQAGTAFAKTRLEVKDVDPRPPPVIQLGPQNQTLPTSSTAMLPCSASGDPLPTIRWFKGDRELPSHDTRFQQMASGMLQINDIRESDTGVYTCRATSETGETSWSAGLIVDTHTNQEVIFRRTPEPSTFPGAPSRPSLSEITQTSIHLSWKANPNHGASPVHNYYVEYFSHETEEGWVVASKHISVQDYVVQNLLPDTAYMFLVRAENTHGLSLPSKITDPIRTLAAPIEDRPQPSLELVREKLRQAAVSMLEPDVISSTAVQIKWTIQKRLQSYIEGFHIKYHATASGSEVTGSRSRRGASTANNDGFTTVTMPTNTATTYILRNLDKYTWYEVQVTPYYGVVEGTPSESVTVRTLEDKPSAAPGNVRTLKYDNNTMLVAWTPPPAREHNGPLLGYKVFVYGNESKYNKFAETNATTTSIVLNGLVPGVNYRVQVLAYNRMGESPKSPDIFSDGKSVSAGLMSRSWVLVLVISLITACVCVLLCLFAICIYQRNKSKKQALKGGNSHQAHKGEEEARLNSYFNAINAPNYLHKDFATHVLQQQNGKQDKHQDQDDLYSNAQANQMMLAGNHSNHTPPMSSFHNRYNNQAGNCGGGQQTSHASPYATTPLLQNNNPNGIANPYPPIHNSGVFQPIPNGSNESCGKPELTSSDSNNETRSNAELLPRGRTNSCELCDHQQQLQLMGSPVSECESTLTEYDNQPFYHQHAPPPHYHLGALPPHVSPMLYLPPPPEHPPPASDVDGDSPGAPRRQTQHYSGGGSYGHSPYGGGGAGHRLPYSHGTLPHSRGGNRGVPTSVGNYSDNEQHYSSPYHMGQQQQGVPTSLAAIRTTPRDSPQQVNSGNGRQTSPKDSSRPYSPQAMSEPERGPTPPIRGYKLLAKHGIDSGSVDPHCHFSDSESAPMPPLRVSSARVGGAGGPHEQPPSPAPEDHYLYDRGIQSSLPSLVSEKINGPHRPDSPSASEVANYESDIDVEGRVSPTDATEDEAMYAGGHYWVDRSGEQGGRDDDASLSGGERGSSGVEEEAEEDDGLLGGGPGCQGDFASHVANNAKQCGLTVFDDQQNKVKRNRKSRGERGSVTRRAASPYSTDSNYSSVQPRPPYPKAQRQRRQPETGAANRGSAHPQPRPRNQLPQSVAELPSYNKPTFPAPSSSSSYPAPHRTSHSLAAAFHAIDTPIV